MEINIDRANRRARYEYAVSGGDGWRASANYTFGVLLRKIRVENPALLVSVDFCDTCWLRNALCVTFWVVCAVFAGSSDFWPGIVIALCVLAGYIMVDPRYIYGRNGVRVGVSVYNWRRGVGFKFLIDGDEYVLRVHSDFKYSVTRNGNQVMLIKRSLSVQMERNHYTVLYSDDMQDRLDVAIAFCVYADVRFNSLSVLNFAFSKTQRERIMFDKDRKLAEWKPGR